MKRLAVMPDMTISEKAYIDDNGKVCTKTWTVEVEYDGVSCGTVVLEDLADLFLLRDALTNYISEHCLVPPEYEPDNDDEEDE